MKKKGKRFKSSEFFLKSGDQNSVTFSFRLSLSDEIDRYIYSVLEKVKQGERTKIIKIALFNYFTRVGSL